MEKYLSIMLAILLIVFSAISGGAGTGNESAPTTSLAHFPESIITASSTSKASAPSSATTPMAVSSSNSEGIIELRFTSGLAPDHPWEMAFHRWAKKIQDETGNKVRFTFIDSSDIMFGVPGAMRVEDKFKNLDICGSNAARLPIAHLLPAFFYGTDVTGARQAFNKIWTEFPEVSAEYTSRNIKRLFGHGEMPFHVQSKKKAIRALDDFNGIRLCVLGGELSEVFTELGATEVPLSMGTGQGLYTAVDNGSIDATLGWIESLHTLGGIGIIKYSINLGVPLPPQDFFEINPSVWEKLPTGIKKIFEDNNAWIENEIDKTSKKMDEEFIEYAKAGGVEFIELSPKDSVKFNNLLKARALKKAAELDAQGYPGTKIFQRARHLIEEYERTKDKKGVIK